MKLFVYYSVIFFTLISCCYSLKILGIFPYQGKSHFFVFRVYLQELAKRGHEVTVISHFPDEKPLPNYYDINLAGPTEVTKDDMPMKRSFLTLLITSVFLTMTGVENCVSLLENKDVQELWGSKKKFDIIVVEQFNSDCALGLAYKIGAPVVGLTSHILMPWHYSRFGIPYNPSYVPFHFIDSGTKPTLYQRIEITFFNAYFNFMFKFITQRQNQNTLAKYFDDVPPLEDLAREMKFLFVYHNFILMGSRLFPANVIEVGGFHVTEPKPLTGDLLKFVEQAENGIIYISFGTFIKSSMLSKDKFDDILRALSELPQRIVWKFENRTMVEKYDNIFVSSWLPQNDILGHPKTLGFVSHCGNLGTTEAIHHGVPVLGIPVLGDQPANAAAIKESGLGVQIHIDDINKATLLEAFNKILDPEFRNNVKKLSKAWHDRPRSPMDTVIFWTEFAARHKNFTFRSASADVPLYQYLCLDVASIMLIFVVIALLIIKNVFSCCWNKMRRKDASENRKKSKSKKA